MNKYGPVQSNSQKDLQSNNTIICPDILFEIFRERKRWNLKKSQILLIIGVFCRKLLRDL